MSENLINRFVMKRELAASSKQRKFYKILAGKKAPAGIKRGELSDLIQEFSAGDVANARIRYKLQKRPSKYKVKLLAKLLRVQVEAIQADCRTRVNVDNQLKNYDHATILVAKRELRRKL